MPADNLKECDECSSSPVSIYQTSPDFDLPVYFCSKECYIKFATENSYKAGFPRMLKTGKILR